MHDHQINCDTPQCHLKFHRKIDILYIYKCNKRDFTIEKQLLHRIMRYDKCISSPLPSKHLK